MSASRRLWAVLAAINVGGGALVWTGADFNPGVHILGLLLLLPGSVIAAVLPIRALWHPALSRCCGTDAEGLSNVLYVPIAVLTNFLLWWLLQTKRSRKKFTAERRDNAAMR